MSSCLVSVSLLLWYLQYLHVIYCHDLRCGHDRVEYDIIRNDHIFPLSSIQSSSSSRNRELLSISSANEAEEWLSLRINDHNNNEINQKENHEISSYANAQSNIANNHDIIQTFSSRKNTKPHRHHTSPHAFEHNLHLRHHPEIATSKNDLLFIDEDENDQILKNSNEWKPFRIHYNSQSLVSSWNNAQEAQHFAENVIPAAMHYLERSLYVRPIQGKLKLSRPCVKFIVDEQTGKKKCIQLKWNWEQCGSHVTIPSSDFEVILSHQNIYTNL